MANVIELRNLTQEVPVEPDESTVDIAETADKGPEDPPVDNRWKYMLFELLAQVDGMFYAIDLDDKKSEEVLADMQCLIQELIAEDSYGDF